MIHMYASKLNFKQPSLLWAALFVVITAFTSANRTQADHHEKGQAPNIVLIISDDQSWPDYSFMGHENIKTPRLDKLASQSMTFTRGYVPDSLCRPSLATMVTGLYPHQHKIVGNDPPGKRKIPKAEYLKRRIDYLKHIENVPTLGRLLAKKGYLSHQSGKWWEGSYQRGGFTHGMTHGDRTKGGRHGDKGLAIGRQGMAPVTDFIDMAIEKKKPFFVYYAPFLPHTPHNPPKRLLDKYRDKTDSLPMAKYWAMCEWFDETCGQLLDHLDKRKVAENTIVLYVVDNGWINQTNRSSYAPKSKRSQYDGGTRTPIMVRWPGKVKPKMDKTTLVNSIDLAPTILAAAGLKPTEAMQGVNLLDADALAKRKATFGNIFEHDIQHMTDPVPSLKWRWVIEGNMKLIMPYKKRFPSAPVELYDLSADPHETKNLAGTKPEVVKDLNVKLDAWWKVD
jgi:arylsulfatase A-like enzyme